MANATDVMNIDVGTGLQDQPIPRTSSSRSLKRALYAFASRFRLVDLGIASGVVMRGANVTAKRNYVSSVMGSDIHNFFSVNTTTTQPSQSSDTDKASVFYRMPEEEQRAAFRTSEKLVRQWCVDPDSEEASRVRLAFFYGAKWQASQSTIGKGITDALLHPEKQVGNRHP